MLFVSKSAAISINGELLPNDHSRSTTSTANMADQIVCNDRSAITSSQQGTSPVSVMILGASYQTGNMGVDALLSGTVAAVLHTFPNVRISILDYSYLPKVFEVRSPRGAARVRLINIRFSKNLLLPNHIARLIATALLIRLFPIRLKKWLLSRNPRLREVQEANIIASLAGGDSFTDLYGLERLVYICLPQLLVLAMGKPLVLLPQTIGPFKSIPGRTIARWILNRAQLVYSRDLESLTSIEPLAGPDRARFRNAHDMAFVLEPLPPAGAALAQLRTLDACRPLVGLNVSGLLYMGGYTRDNMFDLKADYRDLMREIIRFFVQEHNAHVVLVPHVFSDASNSESDGTVCSEIHREMSQECCDRLHLLDGEYDHQQIKYVIGQCDFFLGSRMHACIGALSQCVPAVGLAYSRKFRGVFASISFEDLVIDLGIHEREEVMRRIEAFYQQREEVRKRLRQRIPKVKSAVLDLFSTLLPEREFA
jgi:colanic acid/amylovoran biosynthesis protein